MRSVLNLQRTCSVWVLAALIAGCSDITDPPPPVAWQGELVGAAAAPHISGSAAMASQVLTTQIGIGIENGPPDAVVQWQARTGQCGGTGPPLASAASFPQIQLSDDGAGTATMSLNRRLAADDDYAVDVYQRVSSVDVVLACADLVRRN